MTNKKQQEKYKRWYDKQLWGVYKRNCPVCGAEFYTVRSNQVTCDNETCKAKWETMQREGKELKYSRSGINHANESEEKT